MARRTTTRTTLVAANRQAEKCRAAESQGWLTAIDASTGAVQWKYQSKRPMVSAATATKGNVLLTGELTSDFLVLDAHNRNLLYRSLRGKRTHRPGIGVRNDGTEGEVLSAG